MANYSWICCVWYKLPTYKSHIFCSNITYFCTTKMPNKWMKVNNIECSCMANPRTKQQTHNGKKVFDDQRNALPQTMKAGWTTWYNNSPNILITEHAVCHALWTMHFHWVNSWGRLNWVAQMNVRIFMGSGLWITGQLSWPNLFCYIPGFQQSTAVTISHDLRGFHPSSERIKLPFVPCSVQRHSHLSVFPKNWQQPDLHKPGDRVAFPVCLSVCIHS